MSSIKGPFLLIVLIFISHTASKTFKIINVEPLVEEDQILPSESSSEPPQKPDNSTSAALQGTWEKFVLDKHEHQKAKKHGKLHNTSIPVNHNHINETSSQPNSSSNNETNSSPEFQLTSDDTSGLSLGLVAPEISKIEDNVAPNPSTSNSTDESTEITVTSQPLLLKQFSENNDNDTAINSVPVAVISPNVTEATTTVPSLASAEADDDDDDEEEDEDEDDDENNKSYKDKARPDFHPYFEEILSTENQTDGEVPSPPVVVKQAEYSSSQNALSPFGHLPTFSEKELGRLRLNHWRVKQILKGAVDTQAEKLGLPGSRKEILQSKYPHPVLGQKRAATTSSSAEATYLDDSAADSFSSLLTSADQDKGKQSPVSSSSMSPTNLRTFFSWFTTPKFDENEPYYDPKRAELVKAQQAILPIALDYRGDFLLW